jgi:patatin-like phospholipase/acyl hydrolase
MMQLLSSDKADKNEDDDYYIRDVGRAVSAAPTFFKKKEIAPVKKPDNIIPLVDGGLAANNPSIISFMEALRMFPNRPINLISIGTGEVLGKYHNTSDLPYAQRAGPIIELLFASQTKTADSFLTLLASTSKYALKYHRINVPLQEQYMAMDNASNINTIEELARQYVRYEGQSKINDVVRTIMTGLEKDRK